MRVLLILVAVVTVSAGCSHESCAQQTRPADGGGHLLSTSIHAKSLQHNLVGISTDRNILVYLPPSYDRQVNRRYPVVYVLSGIQDANTVWVDDWDGLDVEHGTLPSLMNSGITKGRLNEMILVIPDVRTPLSGEFYANSPVKGNWEDFIVHDLRSWADSTFRTIVDARARGLLGHSMGGHGALRIGLRHPDLFGAVYAMNPAVLDWAGDLSSENPAFKKLLLSEDPSELFSEDFYVPAIVGIAQAFSPDVDDPPFYFDLPFRLDDSDVVPSPAAFDQWEMNFPVNMISAYAARSERLAAIRFDSAFEDDFSHIPITTKRFSDALTAAGVPHTFEMYNGDHRSRLWGTLGRLNLDALPFFSEVLDSSSELY